MIIRKSDPRNSQGTAWTYPPISPARTTCSRCDVSKKTSKRPRIRWLAKSYPMVVRDPSGFVYRDRRAENAAEKRISFSMRRNRRSLKTSRIFPRVPIWEEIRYPAARSPLFLKIKALMKGEFSWLAHTLSRGGAFSEMRISVPEWFLSAERTCSS